MRGSRMNEGWTRTEDGLPERGRNVLVQAEDGSMMVDFLEPLVPSGWFWSEEPPIAWRELPEEYKKGE